MSPGTSSLQPATELEWNTDAARSSSKQHQSYAGPLRTIRIENLEQFDAIATDWQRLLELSGANPVFMSHTWLRTWWECFGDGRKLCLFAIYAGPALVAAAPLMIETGKMYGLKVRRLTSLYNYHTPRYDFLTLAPRAELYEALWAAIRATQREWDVLVLSQLEAASSTLSQLSEFAQRDGCRARQWAVRPSPYIELGSDFDTFMNRFNSKERYNLRKRQERLKALGSVELEIVRDRERMAEVLDEGFRIEAAAWKGHNGTAINSDPAVRDFYVRFAERAADLGWMRACFLRLNGARIAFNYLIEKDHSLYGVKIGYDPQYHAYGPSHQLLLEILREGCTEGANEYDFLGVDDDWKYFWTNKRRDHVWLFIFANSFRATVLQTAKFRVVPWMKKKGLYQYIKRAERPTGDS